MKKMRGKRSIAAVKSACVFSNFYRVLSESTKPLYRFSIKNVCLFGAMIAPVCFRTVIHGENIDH